MQVRKMKKILEKTDSAIIPHMERLGHRAERYLLGIVFIWFGSLKVMGETSATSIIAKSIYWFEPQFIIPMLGIWEILIGTTLLHKSLLRFSILLLFVRVPGTLLAMVYHYDECFADSILLPTIQGQYLIKELTLIGAALVIGSTIEYQRIQKRS